MAWFALAATIVLEVVATLTLKASGGFTVLLPSVVSIACYIGTLIALARALTVIWTGAGTVGVAVLGIALFGDEARLATWAGLALVIVGVSIINFPQRSSAEEE
jgi:quaternary ammonium compound-resistance protein SugE